MGVYRVLAGEKRFILTLGPQGATLGEPISGSLVTGNLHICEVGSPLILARAEFSPEGEVVAVRIISNKGVTTEVLPLGRQDQLCAVCGCYASLDSPDRQFLVCYTHKTILDA